MPGSWEFVYDASGRNSVPGKGFFPVAASQTLKVGDVVNLSSGRVAKAGDGTGRIVGVMTQDSTNATAGTLVEVAIAQPYFVYKGKSSADASALVLNGTRTYDLNASQQLNTADTTGGSLAIVGLQPGGGNTDVQVVFTQCVFGS